MNQELAHEYKRARAHQRDIANNGGGVMTTCPGGRTEMTFGGCYGEHALSAIASARRAIYFRNDLAKTVKAANKRTRAAKRGWKTRRGAA